ncbi:nuclear transport factor 2 family protein [Pectobacterium brasiliense]|uniref:DUF1348 family protein n=1 Tax=Pectobacterium brasiliense TaxID=180957 RepID=UPI001CE16C39|nr:DUF1348 family protein [Pectobacterium brasiliense]MCA5918384.1 nuclear transport factor 2 family protein [Pectobacterium brasiliense]MCA5926077.1 nuclear transport factor 2 family protein [Pectobacterium brasiliense]MCA5934248.1 nuclear transport factor 2 family protein [Pectobacterium brasiliense]MCA5938430.1 nuclear transport factor 2 family protein [Pectobacterium brasiliense]MCA5943982.1 nuclear transport factor 2 family protein [Pectobacterium brasiliense]
MDGHRPLFALESTQEKVHLAEDVWNARNPERVSLAYTHHSFWRNRGEFIVGRDEAVLLVVKRHLGVTPLSNRKDPKSDHHIFPMRRGKLKKHREGFLREDIE